MKVEKVVILTQKDQETTLFWQENTVIGYLFLESTTRRQSLENVTICALILI